MEIILPSTTFNKYSQIQFKTTNYFVVSTSINANAAA